jgi:hypothetical protein
MHVLSSILPIERRFYYTENAYLEQSCALIEFSTMFFINIFDTSDDMFYVPKSTRILMYIFPLALQKRNFLLTDNFHGLI